MPAASASRGPRIRTGFALADHRAAGFDEAAKRAQRLALAVALGAGESQDFAATNLQRRSPKARAAEVFDGKRDRLRRSVRCLGGITPVRSAPDHQGDQIVLGQVDRSTS